MYKCIIYIVLVFNIYSLVVVNLQPKLIVIQLIVKVTFLIFNLSFICLGF